MATFNSTFSQTGFEKLPNHINMSEETRDWEFPLTKVTATYVRKTENSQYCVVVYWIIWRAPIIRKSDLGLQSFCIAHCQLAHMGHFLITCQTTWLVLLKTKGNKNEENWHVGCIFSKIADLLIIATILRMCAIAKWCSGGVVISLIAVSFYKNSNEKNASK